MWGNDVAFSSLPPSIARKWKDNTNKSPKISVNQIIPMEKMKMRSSSTPCFGSWVSRQFLLAFALLLDASLHPLLKQISASCQLKQDASSWAPATSIHQPCTLLVPEARLPRCLFPHDYWYESNHQESHLSQIQFQSCFLTYASELANSISLSQHSSSVASHDTFVISSSCHQNENIFNPKSS
jgi:hypothetical protein